MPGPMVIVIGAGIAGLACARELARRGVPAKVLERARGVGGRCATRRFDGQPVDYGVPLLHATTREFGNELRELPEDGAVAGWPERLREPRLACQPDAFRPGNRRLARRDGVSEFPKHLARGLDVELNARVVRLEPAGVRTRVVLESGAAHESRFVVLATHLPKTLELLTPLARDWPGAEPRLEQLRRVEGVRCLTVIAGYPADTPEPGFDLWYPLETVMIHALSHDSTKRPNPKHRVLVIQSRDRWARMVEELAPEQWRDELLWEAAELLGPWAKRPEFTHAHRWSWARLRRGDGVGDVMTFESPDGAAVSLCGEAFAPHPGIEAAYISGVAIGEQIANLPHVRKAVKELAGS